MIGGVPYCEYGWIPFLKKVIFWNDEILNQFIERFKNNTYRCFKKSLNSNVFYSDVKNYTDKGRPGHYKRYFLFRFNGEKLYYKNMLIEGYGYFTKFDGEEMVFSKGNNENSCGPNYYDLEQGKWGISEKRKVIIPIMNTDT